MNLNELIEKYEMKIKERHFKLGIVTEHLEQNYLGSMQREKEEIMRDLKNYKDILSDLEQLKEKIENKDDYTFGLYYKEDILGE